MLEAERAGAKALVVFMDDHPRHGDAWKVRVVPAPENGKANAAVVALLADTLALPRGGVSIVSGHASRDKTVALQGIDPEQTERLLAEASAAGKDPE